MANRFRAAPEVEKLAGKLIRKHHEHLHGVVIEFVFRSEAKNKGGRKLLGDAHLVSGREAFMVSLYRDEFDYEAAFKGDAESDGRETDETGYEHLPYAPFFLIEVALDEWQALEPDAQEALVDSLLCRCDVGEKGGLRKVEPDVVEFSAVLERHGTWNRSAEKAAKALAASLPLDWSADEDEDPEDLEAAGDEQPEDERHLEAVDS